jgi:hypothetical protein
MLPQEIIRKKRDGQELTDGEIAFIARGVTDNSLSEGQVAAFAMAVFFRGMTTAERVAMTLGLVRSGVTLDWNDLDLPGPIIDKHSSGGVGDKVSLMLAPIVAACGAFVPMISGRGWAIPAARSTSSPPSRATKPSPIPRPSAGWCARSVARSSARPTTSRRPTAGCTACATSRRRSNRSR